jgi:hypothetical protein
LRLAPALNQAGALQHLQMLGDRRHAHLEGLGQLGYGAFTGGEPGENRTPRWICEGGESRVEVHGRCELLNHSVK